MVRWAAAYLITLKGSLRREESTEELLGQLMAEEIEVCVRGRRQGSGSVKGHV